MRMLFAAATGMAAFLDGCVGMLITLLVAKLANVEIPLWYLLIGSFLALLPDFDLVLQAGSAWLRGKKLAGDHRATIMHIPIVMLPGCTFAAWLIGGWFWTTVTFLCLLYHYVHDSEPFSIGGIDWFWTGQELPWMETPEWLKQYWMRPTVHSVTELLIGVTILAYVANDRFGIATAVAVAAIVIIGNSATWVLYNRVA